jgi:hypothetical protein
VSPFLTQLKVWNSILKVCHFTTTLLSVPIKRLALIVVDKEAEIDGILILEPKSNSSLDTTKPSVPDNLHRSVSDQESPKHPAKDPSMLSLFDPSTPLWASLGIRRMMKMIIASSPLVISVPISLTTLD